MIINNKFNKFESDLSRILEDLNNDNRSKLDVLRELLVIRLAIYLTKSEEVDKIIFNLNKMLYSRKSDFELVLWTVNETEKTMRRMMKLVINPRKLEVI